MAKTIMVCGYGPGISSAVARKFGGEGLSVALVARSEQRLAEGAKALGEAGVTAKPFPCDLSDASAVRQLVEQVRGSLGPIGVIHWNAYAPLAGDLTSADPAELGTVLDVGVVGAVAAVQSALPDLEAAGDGAVLITGGGFAFYDESVDKMCVQYNAMGVAIAKAAQHKLTGLLHEKLAARGIYVGSVVVLGTVTGTAFAQGREGLDPDAIAGAFHELYKARDETYRNFGG